MFEVVDDGVQRRRIHQALIHQQRFERLDPEGDVGRRRLPVVVFVIMVVMVMGHEATLADRTLDEKSARATLT